MSDQPEALRLADELDCEGSWHLAEEAADKLRRQHTEIEQLKAKRYQLAEALRDAKSYSRHPDYDWDDGFSRYVRDLLAAIDAAREMKP